MNWRLYTINFPYFQNSVYKTIDTITRGSTSMLLLSTFSWKSHPLNSTVHRSGYFSAVFVEQVWAPPAEQKMYRSYTGQATALLTLSQLSEGFQTGFVCVMSGHSSLSHLHVPYLFHIARPFRKNSPLAVVIVTERNVSWLRIPPRM